MTRVVTLDTNIYVSLGNAAFDTLVTAEQGRGVLPFADPWTMAELLTHLDDPRDPDYGPSRAAIRRLSRRCLRPPADGRQHGVLADAEVQIAHFVTGMEITENKTSTMELVELCRAVEGAGSGELPGAAKASISNLARIVRETESWFVDYIRGIQNALSGVARAHQPPYTDGERRAAIAHFFQSDEAINLDARALIQRAYSQVGVALPDPIPTELIAAVGSAFHGGIKATALALKRLLSDNLSLDKARTRNLLWDQNIAFNIGHKVLGLRILIVTDDRYFVDAAAEAGYPDSVYDLDRYRTWLGLAV